MLGKEGENMRLRAVGTKAAPGKGRELRHKWKNLSSVLQNLSVMDFSAALGQKAVYKPTSASSLGRTAAGGDADA